MNQQTTFIELPSAPMQSIYNIIQQVVKSNIPFFITGETGVGKEASQDIFMKVVHGRINRS